MDTPTPQPDASAPVQRTVPMQRATPGLGAELRESLALLGGAVAVTVGITTAAQAALTVLS